MQDVDGLLRGLLFFGAVVWAGHFCELGFCSAGLVQGWWVMFGGFAFFSRCGGGDACVVGGLSEREVPRDVRRVGGRVVTFSGVWGVQGSVRG